MSNPCYSHVMVKPAARPPCTVNFMYSTRPSVFRLDSTLFCIPLTRESEARLRLLSGRATSNDSHRSDERCERIACAILSIPIQVKSTQMFLHGAYEPCARLCKHPSFRFMTEWIGILEDSTSTVCFLQVSTFCISVKCGSARAERGFSTNS